MNSRHEKESSRWLDGELAPERAERIKARLETDPKLRESVDAWKQIGTYLREAPPLVSQTPEAAWADVQRALRATPAVASGPAAFPWSPRLAWSGGLLALLLLVAFGGFSLHLRRYGGGGRTVATAQPVEVEWVDIEWPDATPLVYQDDETGLTVIWMVELEIEESADADS